MPLQNNDPVNIEDYRSELKERESEIHLLQETFQLVASELDLDKIYNIICERAIKLVDAETLLLPILDDNMETYTYKAGAGNNVDEIIGESLPLDFGVCGWVWKHRRAWWRGVLKELDENERNKWEKDAGSLILVPLLGRKHFLGGIAAFNKRNGLDFSRRDLEMMSMFAGIVSIAMENAITVKALKDTQDTLIEHQHRLERLNKQYSESSRKIEQLSLYDSLTGLPNRTLFNDRLKIQLEQAQNTKQTLSIILIDIDNFKTLNDALGHDIGDQILSIFCKRITRHTTLNDTLGRLGGDEFILILQDTSVDKTEQRARRLLHEFESPLIIQQKDININASMGISIFPQDGKDKSSLLRHADISLHIAKQTHSGYHIFDQKQDESSDEQLGLALDINEAFQHKQFELHYQPKIDIKTNTIVSAEALGRWNHPRKGYISPGIFIEALEQYNLIDRYTFEAIDMALEQINRWLELGHNIKIAINISTKTLMNPDFIEQVQTRITDFTLSRRIIFEITESLFLSDNDYVLDVLTRIRSLGIELSIDDFGTGYSSLSRLKQLPVNELKIDQSFIRDMTDNIDDQIIVKSIIDLAHNLGLSVVAEGVETQKIIDQLKRMGCDIAQGYLISKPKPASEFEHFIESYR